MEHTASGIEFTAKVPSGRTVRFSRRMWTDAELAKHADPSTIPGVDPSLGNGVRIIILGAGAAGRFLKLHGGAYSAEDCKKSRCYILLSHS